MHPKPQNRARFLLGNNMQAFAYKKRDRGTEEYPAVYFLQLLYFLTHKIVTAVLSQSDYTHNTKSVPSSRRQSIRANSDTVRYKSFQLLSLFHSSCLRQTPLLPIMQFKITILFAFVSAMYASASILPRQCLPVCQVAGGPCAPISAPGLACCSGLSCKTILGEIGFVSISSQVSIKHQSSCLNSSVKLPKWFIERTQLEAILELIKLRVFTPPILWHSESNS